MVGTCPTWVVGWMAPLERECDSVARSATFNPLALAWSCPLWTVGRFHPAPLYRCFEGHFTIYPITEETNDSINLIGKD